MVESSFSPPEEIGWTGPWQGALSNIQTNERTSFPVENLPPSGNVKSFPRLKLSLLHPLTFQEFPFVSKSSKRNTNLMDINICTGFVGSDTYQYRKPFLLEIVCIPTTRQNHRVISFWGGAHRTELVQLYLLYNYLN